MESTFNPNIKTNRETNMRRRPHKKKDDLKIYIDGYCVTSLLDNALTTALMELFFFDLVREVFKKEILNLCFWPNLR